MNIKDLFDKAENGTLTYEQFVKATENAKFVDLSEGKYVDKQKYTDDLASRDTRITSLDETLKSRDADLSALKQQLESAGADEKKLAEITNNFAELQKKYDADTKALESKMSDQAYRFAVNRFADTQEFSSNAAKRDFVNTMLGKKLVMEGDTIIGANDFVQKYTENNADAFVQKQVQQEQPAKSQPHFVGPTSPATSNKGDENTFKFNFTGIRPH